MEWILFDPDEDFEKDFYAVKLKDGEVCSPCWPNAGLFHLLTPGNTGLIDYEYVQAIRVLTKEELRQFTEELNNEKQIQD